MRPQSSTARQLHFSPLSLSWSPCLAKALKNLPDASIQMLAYLSIAVLLLLGALAGAQVTITVSDVPITLSESLSSQGEQWFLSSKLIEISITCNVNTSTAVLSQSSVVWRRTNSNISITQSDSRTSVTTTVGSGGTSATSRLAIKYPVKADITTYVCAVNDTTATGSFTSRPLLTMSMNGENDYDVSVWPGTNVAIKCVVNGNPAGDIRWTKSTDASFSVTNNDTIYMNSVSYDRDRGFVTCTSNNTRGQNKATMFLRVKDPTSYIPPLVSICCELFVIALIVVAFEIYDKRRRRVADGDPKSE